MTRQSPLLPFVSGKLRKPVDRLAVRDLTSGLVRKFLTHLEDDRGCSVRTRNQRLATIRAFARFVGSRDPAHVEWSGHIRAIASKKSMSPPVGWLTSTEMEAMLAVPDRKTSRARREYALLLFLYKTGARVSEATQLKVRDLKFGRSNGGHDLALQGKGGKMRQCPLWPETERVLANEVLDREAEAPVFVSRLRTQFTRFGVYRLIERCAAGVPELAARTITPHVIRHTTACHLVLAGVDINTIRAWLGHVSISTTNIYAEIDLTLKANAVALCEIGQQRPRTLMEGGQRLDGLPEIPATRPSPHIALVATSGMNRLASCGGSWRRSDRSRDGASAPLSGTGRDRLKAAAMRHEDVIRCGLCGRKLAIIEQNEAQAVQRANCMTLEISP